MIKKPNLAKQTIDSINIHESRNEASTEFLNSEPSPALPVCLENHRIKRWWWWSLKLS